MTTKQEQLKQLFHKRRDAYNKTSSSILEHIRADILDAIKEFFADNNEVGEHKTLEWDQVGYAEPHNMLVLIGLIRYAPGATVVMETGDVVTITEELAPYYHRIIRVGLPFEMVDEPKDKVKEFLKNREIEREEEQEEAAEFVRQLLKAPGEGEDNTVFDFDSLTEEQRKGLIVPKGGKVN